MLFESIAVPFSIRKVHQGFSRLDGIITVSETGLFLEYELSILGLMTMRVKELTISLHEIDSIRLKKNLFTAKLIVRTRGLRPLSQMPGSKQGQVALQISRSDRKKAESLASALRLYASEYALKCALKAEVSSSH